MISDKTFYIAIAKDKETGKIGHLAIDHLFDDKIYMTENSNHTYYEAYGTVCRIRDMAVKKYMDKYKYIKTIAITISFNLETLIAETNTRVVWDSNNEEDLRTALADSVEVK